MCVCQEHIRRTIIVSFIEELRFEKKSRSEEKDKDEKEMTKAVENRGRDYMILKE